MLGVGLTAVIPISSPQAQELRDPTRAPPGAFAQVPQAGSSASDGEGIHPASAAVFMRDGKPYLIYGARWYAVGQQMGQYKIERITETEVWLRSSQGLQKIQRYDGIQRRTVQP